MLQSKATDRAVTVSTATYRAFAVLRIATGFLFLWAFLDKTFGFGYATKSDAAWINGGSPTKGFLSHLEVGPFKSAFQSIGGTWFADWLFMLGLLGIGVAVILGIGLRLSAIAGTIMMLLMWVAEWPLATTTPEGAPTMSTNPIVDYHIVYALVLIAFAYAAAGNTWGLGRQWAKLPFVDKNRWLI